MKGNNMDKTLKVTVGTKTFWIQVLRQAQKDSLGYLIDGYDSSDYQDGDSHDWSRHGFLADRTVRLLSPQIQNMVNETGNAVTLLPNVQEYLKHEFPLMMVGSGAFTDRFYYKREREVIKDLMRVLV